MNGTDGLDDLDARRAVPRCWGWTVAPVPPDDSAVSLGHGWIVQDRQQRDEATEARLKDMEERLNARIDELVNLIKGMGMEMRW